MESTKKISTAYYRRDFYLNQFQLVFIDKLSPFFGSDKATSHTHYYNRAPATSRHLPIESSCDCRHCKGCDCRAKIGAGVDNAGNRGNVTILFKALGDVRDKHQADALNRARQQRHTNNDDDYVKIKERAQYKREREREKI